MLVGNLLCNMQHQLRDICGIARISNGDEQLLSNFAISRKRKNMSAQANCSECGYVRSWLFRKNADLDSNRLFKRCPTPLDLAKMTFEMVNDGCIHGAGFAPRLRLHDGHSSRVPEL